LYGEKIDMEPWRATIREIFERGIRDKGAKQSASLILESLEKRYPFRMDIPGEADINTEIQRLFRLQKEGRPLDTPAGRGLDKRYVATLREAIDQNLTKDETLDYFRSKWGATEAALTALGGPKSSKFLQDKTTINKWAQMRRARQSADHG
ncbi:Hypothetical Protein FCC1311_118352, partial [Hondaea fermentalgiana]